MLTADSKGKQADAFHPLAGVPKHSLQQTQFPAYLGAPGLEANARKGMRSHEFYIFPNICLLMLLWLAAPGANSILSPGTEKQLYVFLEADREKKKRVGGMETRQRGNHSLS